MEEQERPPKASRASKHPPHEYSKEHKLAILRALSNWKGTKREFYRTQGVPQTSLWAWERAYKARGEAGLDKVAWGRDRKKKKQGRATPETKRKAVEAFGKSGQSIKDFGKLWG